MKILFLGPTCPVIENALKNVGHIVQQTEEALDEHFFESHTFDFAISYRYKKIIKQKTINYFKNCIINLHISLLPWNRGSDPNFWSYIDNTPRGVTIHKIDAGIDTGHILLQQAVSIDTEYATLKSSYDLLSHTVEQLFIENIDALLRGTIIPQEQVGASSYHNSHDKVAYLYLIEDMWWDTPVKKLLMIEKEEEKERKRESHFVTYRPVDKSYKQYIYKLANDPVARNASLNTAEIQYKDHCKWFTSIFLQNNILFYIIEYKGTKCGYIRFYIDNYISVISIVIDAKYRNKSIGLNILQMLCKNVLRRNDVHAIQAIVHHENHSSKRLFEKSHFSLTGACNYGGRLFLTYTYPNYNEF